MRKIFPAFLLLLFSAAGAQVNIDSTANKILKNNLFDYKTAISFNPFALINVDYTLMAGAEQRLNPKTVLAVEAGYIFASGYIGQRQRNQNLSERGFIIRPALKFFLNDKNSFYLQPQAFYKQVTHHVYDWLGKDVVNGVPSYEQLQNFRYRRKVVGVNAVAGVLVPLDRKGNAYIDFYLGFGVRNKSSKVVGEPHSVYNRRGGILFGDDADNGTYPSLPGGLRFLFTIN
jgi:hypothetical protein